MLLMDQLSYAAVLLMSRSWMFVTSMCRLISKVPRVLNLTHYTFAWYPVSAVQQQTRWKPMPTLFITLSLWNEGSEIWELQVLHEAQFRMPHSLIVDRTTTQRTSLGNWFFLRQWHTQMSQWHTQMSQWHTQMSHNRLYLISRYKNTLYLNVMDTLSNESR